MDWIKRGTEESIKDIFLRNIKATSLNEINSWFQKSYTHKYTITGLCEAVGTISSSLDKPITIIGDYDGDGITATSIMYLALKWLGAKSVRYRIPHRFSEGYGINASIIDEIPEGLVITVDNGIAQLETIAKAKDKGLTVIIIDHHLPRMSETGIPVLPNADVIIDPSAIKADGGFDGYCGAGLAYKVAEKLVGYNPGLCQMLLQYAAIGTVTDVMELREENYVFVRNGLKTMTDERYCTTGFYALINTLNLDKNICAKDIGFKLGPTLNAASRMNDTGADDVVALLTYTGNYYDALPMATALRDTNNARKECKKKGIMAAEKAISDGSLATQIPIVVYLPSVKEGIAGIIAGYIVEKYNVPAVVLVDAAEDGVVKGSARSCGNYNMKTELDKVAALMLRYGGHKGAAGMSLEKANISAFRDALMANVKDFVNEDTGKDRYDLEIQSKDIPQVLAEISKYAPYGQGNPEIVLKIDNFASSPYYGSCKKLMDDGSTVKVFAKNMSAVGFGITPDQLAAYDFDHPNCYNMLGVVSENYFDGCPQIEFAGIELKPKSVVTTDFAQKISFIAKKSTGV